MGKYISKFGGGRGGFGKGEEDEEEIRKYEENLENRPYGYGLAAADTSDLRQIKWWQYLIFDLRFRIAYALVLAIVVGVAVPVILHSIMFESPDATIYGSCLIKPDSRFQCLINNAAPATRAQCVDSGKCCWEENDELLFKCYHSFPSAYQYDVGWVGSGPPGNGSSNNNNLELRLSPKSHTRRNEMSDLTIWVEWVEEDHLNVRIFNPAHYPERSRGRGGGVSFSSASKNGGLLLNHGAVGEYFFLEIIREGESGLNETIFDTRLGPIYGGEAVGDFITFSTTLPTPYFYGLTGGEGIGSRGTLSYGVVNGFQNAETPFYMSLEKSGSWHGVLLDTTLPFMTQVLQAPGIGFYLEGPKAEINLHLFGGPSQSQVLTQLHAFISKKGEEAGVRSPYIPPYWALGLHLCRETANSTSTLDHILLLNEIINEESGERRIPYDSDCVDSALRTPFAIDPDKWGGNEQQQQLQALSHYLVHNVSKKIVLSQGTTLPWSPEIPVELLPFILMEEGESSSPFVGFGENGQRVIYPDFFHPDIFSNLSLWSWDLSPFPSIHGLVLLDNYPRNEGGMNCSSGGTALRNLLQGPTPNATNGWGSICPEILHTTRLGDKTHLELHNVYGLESSRKFGIVRDMYGGDGEGFLQGSTSGWTESLYYGAQGGMDVPFSWIGLRESVAHTLRHFILSPVVGTPICGTILKGSPGGLRDDANLCLRWYQFGLLLPYVYHNYAHGNVSRGPLDFPQRYQDYLKAAIQQRYTFAPYYYSSLKQYERSFAPPIAPLSYHFHSHGGVRHTEIWAKLDQFMIGEAILAAPIVKPELQREVYFPPGKYYDLDGLVAWDEETKGGTSTVTGIFGLSMRAMNSPIVAAGQITQTPLFIRGGFIIPNLEAPSANSILESRMGNYSLLVGLLNGESSTGYLILEEGRNGTNSELEFEVRAQWEGGRMEVRTRIVVVEGCDELPFPKYSTTIDSIKYLGFPRAFTNLTIVYEEHGNSTLQVLPGDDLDFLRVFDIGMDWCLEGEAHINIHATIPESD